MKEQLFYRLTCGFADIGKMIPIEEDIYDHIDDLNKSWFKSIYFYNAEQKKQAEEVIEINGKLRARGVSGIADVKTNKICFDFDSKDDIEKARKDAVIVCERLLSHKIEESSLQISYSGMKGFGIEVEFSDIWFTPQEVKNLVNDFIHDLETADSVIVNAARIFRVVLTKHNSSDYYKTPLTFQELQFAEMERILDFAKDTYEPDCLNIWKTTKVPETFHQIKNIELEVQKPISPVAGQEHDIDFTNMPKGFTKWKYALLQGYFPEGTRSNSLIILASTLRYLGYSETTAYYMLKSAADLQSRRFDTEKFSKEDIWNTVISQVYSSNWRGGCYSEDNFPPALQKYLLECGVPRSRKVQDGGLRNVKDLFGSFKDFAENIDKNTIKLGIEAIDKNTRITTGMLFGLLGGAGSGKTSISLTVLNQCSLNNEEAVFFSMDMNANLIYQKLCQKHTGKSGEQIFNLFKNRNTEEIKKISYKVNQNYVNTSFDFQTALSVEDMKNKVLEHEDSTGKKVKLVVVDYLECIVGPYSDPTANGGFVANALKDMASDLDVCVLLLLQTQKASGDVAEPLRSMRKVKGSSVLEQACSIIISMWREGFDPRQFQDDRFITFCCVKNRLGRLFEEDCGWEGITGDVYELDDAEKECLEELRNIKLKEKKMNEL